MNDNNNRPIALVTGGSKGIGRAICVELGRSGFDVVVNFHSDEKGALETLQQVNAQGGGGPDSGL